MNAPPAALRLLAVDSGSPRVSVAVSFGDEVLARRSMAMEHSSEALLEAIDGALREAGMTLSSLDGMVGLRGPGSFTGLRVGLATLLGLHQATGLPAVAAPTLDVLALAASVAGRTVAAVDALRGQWFVRVFDDGLADGPAAIRTPEELAALAPQRLVGQQVERLRSALPAAVELVEAGDLAPVALTWARRFADPWDPATLLEPLYLRPPAIHAGA
jgi:tRNA threonylcarbamoyladenosine biosynthesis protein TsaB